MVQTDLFDEQGTLKSLQKDAQAIAKQFDAIAKLKPGDPESLDVLQKSLAKLPTGEQIARAVDELRDRAAGVLKAARPARAESFRRHEAEFIRAQRAAGTSVRESGNSAWRIGPVELEFQRDSSRARALYNREVMVPWKPIGSEGDLQRIYEYALKNLEASAIPTETLPSVMWEAYEHLHWANKRSHTDTARVPLGDFFQEVRVALARHELRGKPDRKLRTTEMPRWAFLYNIDRYRRILPDVSSDRRLGFETGSQHDHQRGLAMVVNGLDADKDYKSFCYVYSPHDRDK